MRWSIALALAGAALAASGVRGARADVAAVTVPILDERGAAVFCTRDDSGGRARPEAGGGYRFVGLRAGQWVIAIELPHERVDVLVTIDDDGDVVIPPVIARGRCQRLSLVRRPDVDELIGRRATTWRLRYGRTYRAAPGAVGLVAAPRLSIRWR
ncbi:MAG TPA: hypothetical protein VM734_09470 [Kofleriaceae bacterium]|nr:hypothetical protein [Kofleriaceae bacterium]